MTKFFEKGTEYIDSILDDEFSDEGFNFTIEKDELNCNVESSRDIKEMDISAALNRTFEQPNQILKKASF